MKHVNYSHGFPVFRLSDFSFCEETRTWVADASSLGLVPGDFPPQFTLLDVYGRPFVRCGDDRQDGELTGVRYTADGHHHALIVND